MERESTTLLWLPGAFLAEVVAWEVGSRLGLSIVDPMWEEFGRSIQVEQITWGLGVVVMAAFVLFMLISRQHSTLQLSLVQLLGVLAMACYWVGASIYASGGVVLTATLAAWILGQRGQRGQRGE